MADASNAGSESSESGYDARTYRIVDPSTGKSNALRSRCDAGKKPASGLHTAVLSASSERSRPELRRHQPRRRLDVPRLDVNYHFVEVSEHQGVPVQLPECRSAAVTRANAGATARY